MKCQFKLQQDEKDCPTFEISMEKGLIHQNDVIVSINKRGIIHADGDMGILRVSLANIHDLGLRIETI